jgi:hypothetical protein
LWSKNFSPNSKFFKRTTDNEISGVEMANHNSFFQTSLVLDAKVVRNGRMCTLVLISSQTKRSVSRPFASWPDLRLTLARFVANDRLGLADSKLGGAELEATHIFVSVPFPRLPLQALGFALDDLTIMPDQETIGFNWR